MEQVAVGDVFLCLSAEGAQPVVATVGRVESCADLGVEGPLSETVIVHVSTVGVDASVPDARVTHGPYDLATFLRFAARRVAEGRPPAEGFEAGHAAWREAWDAGEAGWFTISPADVLAMAMAVVAERRQDP